MARLMVVSHVKVRSAAVMGMGVVVAAVSDVPNSNEPMPTTVPAVPNAVTMPRHSRRQGQAAAPDPVVIAADSAMTVVMAAATVPM